MDYDSIMRKYVEPTTERLTKKGIERTNKVVELLSQIGLKQSLEISKALIENYYLNEKLSKPIIDLIDKNCIIQDCAETHKKN